MVSFPGTRGSLQGFDRRIWILFYGRIATAAGFCLAIPFLSLYLHNELGITMSVVGLVLLVATLIGSMGQIVGGELADRYGRRKVMILGLAWRAVAFLLISIAIGAGADYILLAGLITLSSFGGSMYDPASNAMIADIVEPSKRLEAYSFLRIAQNIGWAVGPLIGGILTIWVSFSTLFLLGSIATLAVTVFLYLYIQESLRPGQATQRFSLRDIGHVISDRTFMIYCLVSMFLFIMFGQMSSTYAVFGTDTVGLSLPQVGYLWAWNGVLVIFLQFPIARKISPYKMSSVMAFGALLYAVGYGITGFADGFLFLLLTMTIITFGEMVVSPAAMNLTANMSPENERGRYMGVFGLASSIGFSMGPFAGGVIMDTVTQNDVLMWACIGIFGVIAAIGYVILGRHLSAQKNSSNRV
jgi:MFS family permease